MRTIFWLGAGALCLFATPGWGQSIYAVSSSQNGGRHVIALDGSDGRVQSMHYLSLDESPGPLNSPQQAIVTSAGEVWVTDSVTGTIHVWDRNGVDYLREELSGTHKLYGLTEHAGSIWVCGRITGATGDTLFQFTAGSMTLHALPFDPVGIMPYGPDLLISHRDGATRFDIGTLALANQVINVPFAPVGQPTPALNGTDIWLPVFVGGVWNLRRYDNAGNQLSSASASGSGMVTPTGILELGNGALLVSGNTHSSDNVAVMMTDATGSFFAPIVQDVRGFFLSRGPDPTLGNPYCDPNAANSTGLPAGLGVTGSPLASDQALRLSAHYLPPNVFGFFLNGRAQGVIPMAGGAQGNLCLGGGPIGRYNGLLEIGNSTTVGFIHLTVDTTMMPTPTTPVVLMSGETWNFQCWYRDTVGGMPASNFTHAVSVTF